MRRIAIALVILLLIGGGLFFITRPKSIPVVLAETVAITVLAAQTPPRL